MSVFPMSTGMWPLSRLGGGAKAPAPSIDPMTLASLMAWVSPGSRNYVDDLATIDCATGDMVRVALSRDNHQAFTGDTNQLAARSIQQTYTDSNYNQATRWTDPQLVTDGQVKCWQFGDTTQDRYDDLTMSTVNDTTYRRFYLDLGFTLSFPVTMVVMFKVQWYHGWNTILDNTAANSIGLHTDDNNCYMYNQSAARINPKLSVWQIVVLFWGNSGPVDADSAYILNGGATTSVSPGTYSVSFPGMVLGNKPTQEGDSIFYGWMTDYLLFNERLTYDNAIGVSSYVNNLYGNIAY